MPNAPAISTAARRRRQADDTKRRTADKRAVIAQHKAARGCSDCGEPEPIVLDLHHRDGTEKNPRLRTSGGDVKLYQLGWDDLAVELEKCDVLCANCHRRRHAC